MLFALAKPKRESVVEAQEVSRMRSKILFPFLLIAELVLGDAYFIYDLFVPIGTDAAADDRSSTGIPLIDGAKKVDQALPLAVTLELSKTLPRYRSYGFEAYATERTAGELESFYSMERMKAAGWQFMGPCSRDVQCSSLSRGGVCVYTSTKSGSALSLAVYVAESPLKNERFIFFLRFDVEENDR